MVAPSYIIFNCAAPTTAALVKQPTGAVIRTMQQLRPALSRPGMITAWGVSFDGAAAATPGVVELFETSVAATMTTAYAAADIMPHGNSGAPANTAGVAGDPFNLSTATSGFASAAVTEGVVAGYRAADGHLIEPTGRHAWQFPLGREFSLAAQMYLRLRVTFGATVNMISWLVVEF